MMDYMNYSEEAENQNQNHYRMLFIVAAAIVLCIILGISLLLLINTGIKSQKYNSAINAGNNYYSAGDYQNAIQQYQLAVSVDAKKDTGYLNLASAYMSLGDYDSAAAILNQGLLYSKAQSLNERIGQLQTLENTQFSEVQLQNLSDEQIAELSRDVTVENNIFDVVACYTYTEYYRDYGSPISNARADNQVVLSYGTEGFSTIYYNLADEKVLDNSGNMPIATAKPCFVRFYSLDRIFSCKGEIFVISFAKLQELLGENASLQYDESNNRYYVLAEYKKCRISVETDKNGNVISKTAWNQIEPLNRTGIEESVEADGEVKGYVQDAVTGKGMKATLTIRNRGSKTGNVIDELTSEKDGNYTYGGAQGMYTVEVSAAGYVTEYLDIEIIRGQVKSGKNVVLSPVVEEGEIRIVLTWSSSPTDLDSHAEGRTSGGANFHISYHNKTVNNVGTLDVDDVNGYGPETITITDSEASFSYSVVDFTQSGNMASSAAIVNIYLPGRATITYNVPSGSGNTWEVFRYQNGQITPINFIN